MCKIVNTHTHIHTHPPTQIHTHTHTRTDKHTNSRIVSKGEGRGGLEVRQRAADSYENNDNNRISVKRGTRQTMPARFALWSPVLKVQKAPGVFERVLERAYPSGHQYEK
jgi:hypothetical protein